MAALESAQFNYLIGKIVSMDCNRLSELQAIVTAAMTRLGQVTDYTLYRVGDMLESYQIDMGALRDWASSIPVTDLDSIAQLLILDATIRVRSFV